MTYVRGNGLRSPVGQMEASGKGVQLVVSGQETEVTLRSSMWTWSFHTWVRAAVHRQPYASLERRAYRWPVTRAGLTKAPDAWWHHPAPATELALRDAGQEYMYRISEPINP